MTSDGLFQSLEHAARQSPRAPAVVDTASTICFEDLVVRSGSLCAMFEDVGVEPGDKIAVVLPNSGAFAISAFAVWKRGAVLVPLHVQYLEDELLSYISECEVRAIIATQRMSPTVELIQRRAPAVEHAWLWSPDGKEARYVRGNDHAKQERSTDGPGTDLDLPAITQYSTGSTGWPKRVTRSHRQLLGEVESVSHLMGLGADDRVLGAAPFFHSFGLVNALLCPVLSGACVYPVNDFFPKDIASQIEREQITGFPGVPFMYQLLADDARVADFGRLRYALSAGAPLSRTTAEAFRSKYPIPIRQLYGTTETGVVAIERETGEGVEVSVGVPIPGVSIRILDAGHQPFANGEEGRVAIESRFAASKYDNPKRPADSSFEGSIFFPGDLGYIDPDGRLVLCGRGRGFINVAGNKVDPAEVEAVLKQLPAVSEAVVLGVPDGSAGEKVKAAIVVSAPCTRGDILSHCSMRLADFKRPRSIEFRKELPRSPLGKILRKYLIDDEGGRRPEYVFDPRNGFKAATEELSCVAAKCDLSTLSPFLRTLLITDGTITKNLEAYFWEPIDVELLMHVETRSEPNHSEMGLRTEGQVLQRRIVLRGRFTGSAYAFAETLIACDGLDPEFRRMLVEERKGIGELLRAWRLETYRELLAVERSQAGQWAGYLGLETAARVAIRRYNICHNRRAVIEITEVFPEERF